MYVGGDAERAASEAVIRFAVPEWARGHGLPAAIIARVQRGGSMGLCEVETVARAESDWMTLRAAHVFRSYYRRWIGGDA